MVDDQGSSTTFVVILRRHQGVAQGTSRTSGRSPPYCNTAFAIAGAHGSFAWTLCQMIGRTSSKTGYMGKVEAIVESVKRQRPRRRLVILPCPFWKHPPPPKCSRDPERAQMLSLEPSSSTWVSSLASGPVQLEQDLFVRPNPILHFALFLSTGEGEGEGGGEGLGGRRGGEEGRFFLGR